MNYFFSIVISCEKRNTIVWNFADPMYLFIKLSIFHNFWPKLRPRFWDISSISGYALRNHFFSIALSCEKAKKRLCEVLRIRCTFSSKIQFFISIDLNWAKILRYFLNFRKCAYESLLQHRVILRKSKKRFCEVMRIRCTFSSNLQFFIIIGQILHPDFKIFSQFQEMRLWITSSAS